MLKEKYAKEIESLLARYPEDKKVSAILSLMHIAQKEYGYMSQEAKEEVADILGIDPTHVLSITGFYSLYYEEPVGEYVLEICNDLACALRGADEFIDMACQKLGVQKDEITPDGLFSIKNVMCLGACDRAPMLQCNLKFHEHLDEEKFDQLIDHYRQRAAEGDDRAHEVVDKILIETHH
ncbi:MAG: NAD(P)H-dependent oxidoreductase subunit E [Ardenticatenaceae bacterium]|nr:NAD(P)H-dependent oxidoreductase subunit E [Ardenticatenaceae bacterium]